MQKKIEKRFAKKYPEKWVRPIPRLTFSDKPYVDALANGDASRKNNEANNAKFPNIEEIWEQWRSRSKNPEVFW